MSEPRYVRKNATIYDFSLCKLCGSAGGTSANSANPACHVAVCKACGSDQCECNGLGHGQCGICHIGILDFFPGRSWGTKYKCGYKGCTQEAVAFAPRVRKVCAEHALTAKQSKNMTVAEYVQKQLDERSKHWELRG